MLKSNSLKSSSPSSGHCFNVASPKTEPIKNFDTETSSQPSTAIVPSQSQQSSSSGSGHIPTHLPSKMSIVEEEQNSRFVHKPMKGWLHADQSILSKEGVTYKVRVRLLCFFCLYKKQVGDFFLFLLSQVLERFHDLFFEFMSIVQWIEIRDRVEITYFINRI